MTDISKTWPEVIFAERRRLISSLDGDYFYFLL